MIGLLEVPPQQFLLSVYGPWCDLLYETDFSIETPALQALWQTSGPQFGPLNSQHLQAVLLELPASQIRVVATLDRAFTKRGTLRKFLR